MKSFAFALVVLVSAVPALAQHDIHIGLAGGGAIPVGVFDSSYSAGPDALVTIVAGPADSPLGLRFDYNYAGFEGRSVDGIDRTGTHVNSLTANLVIAARAGALKPYLIGGGGWYPYTEPGETSRTNGAGLNGGAGIGFPLPYLDIGGFLEVRYHAVHASGHADRRFVPITFGVMF